MKSVQNIHYPENKDTISCRSGREGQSQSPVRACWIPGFGKRDFCLSRHSTRPHFSSHILRRHAIRFAEGVVETGGVFEAAA